MRLFKILLLILFLTSGSVRADLGDQGIRNWTLSNSTDSVGAIQTGTWSSGRTWTLLNTTDSVNAVQSGTWTTARSWTLGSGTDSITSFQGTSPWVSNITQFGGINLSTGVGASGAGIPRVTVSNDSNVLATQSGTWTVQQGTPPWQEQGNVASAAADSGNPVKVGGVFRTANPTFTDGQRADLQLNSHGLPLVDVTSTDISGTFTATGNTAALDASGYSSLSFTLDTSAASGTAPTLDVMLQESQDGVNDWTEVFDADRDTASGTPQFVPAFKLSARYYRYRYVIGGTTPSFTFTVRTTLKPYSAPLRRVYNKFNDLVMTASNNFSSIVDFDGCSFSSVQIMRGAGGAGVTLAPQFSNDGINWVNSATTINSSASTSYFQTNGQASNISRYMRFTNTSSNASATTLDLKWYCKE